MEGKIRAFLKELIPLVIKKHGQNHRVNDQMLSGKQTQQYLLNCLEKDLDLVIFQLLSILKRKYESDEEYRKWRLKTEFPNLKR